MARSSESPIRIAFVLHIMQVAGAEMLVAEIIRRLGDRLAPTVLCLDGVGPLGSQMMAEGVPVVSLGRRPGFDLPVARRLARELRDRRIEIVHAHQYTPFFYSALAKVQVRRRPHLIFTEHGRHYPDIVSRQRFWANKILLGRLADDVTGVCAFSARSLADIDGFTARPIAVIENGIEIPALEPPESRGALRARLGLHEGRRYIICVARFHPVKDHATLLRAFAQVALRRSDTDLLLAGDGTLRTTLEGLTRELGLSSRVTFLGVRHDVPTLLRAADVFALTSISEAASLTLLEALAAGLPVVVTDVGGNPEIIRSGIEGRLVPRGDVTSTANALCDILEDAAMAAAMGRAGRQRVQERYQLDDTIQAYYHRYKTAVDSIRRS